jgi:hypothetical protein
LHSNGRPSLRPCTPGGREATPPASGYPEGIHLKANWYNPPGAGVLFLVEGKLFIRGGTIVSTRLTETGVVGLGVGGWQDASRPFFVLGSSLLVINGQTVRNKRIRRWFLCLNQEQSTKHYVTSPRFGGCSFFVSSISASISLISDFIFATDVILSARKGTSIVRDLVIAYSP